jgi:hypothetical protein
LFNVSQHRGKYPQCFLKDESGAYKFVGLWEDVESLVECNTLPADVLAANPQIQTFNQVQYRCSLYGTLLFKSVCLFRYVPLSML